MDGHAIILSVYVRVQGRVRRNTVHLLSQEHLFSHYTPGTGGSVLSFFRKIFRPKNPDSRAFREQRAMELHGQAIRYVTERRNDTDEIIGRGGCLSVRNGEFLLLSSGEILLRARAEELRAAYLLSGDGVVLTAPNLEEGGKERTVIAHFVYYRK